MKRRSNLVGCLLVVLVIGTGARVPATHASPPIEDSGGVTSPAQTEPRYVAPTRRDRIGRIWAPVYINDKGPFRLVLDTGASGSAVTAATAAALQLLPESQKVVLLQGATGSALVPTIAVDSIVIGDLALRGSRVPIVADAFGGADGILGSDGLQDKRIYIDFQRDRIVIARSRLESPAPRFVAIPFRLESGLLRIAEVRVGHVVATAIIDTGAQVTLANSALRAALRRDERSPLDHPDQVVGNTLEVEEGLRIEVPFIQLGGIQIRRARVIAGDIHFFAQRNLTHTPALVLGMDILGLVDTLVIDYRRHEVQIRPRV